MQAPTTEKPPASPFSGRTYLLIAIAILGSASAVVRKLTEIGEMNLIEGRNPISFCNVLFIGNLCALILLAILYYRQWRIPVLKQINGKQWLNMTIVAILSAAVVPTLIFTAIAITSVNNVILIGQIDTPLVLALSVLLLGERINRWVIVGASLAFIGVALTVILPAPDPEMTAMGLTIDLGSFLTLVAAVFKAIANLISKLSLKEIPLGIFSVFRMIVGTIVFFVVTLTLYGPEHFMDVTSPFLWQWMLIYSAVIVVGGQLFWFSGLKRSNASEISLATAFNPIVGVLAAFLILREIPTTAQFIGGAVILLGIAFNQIGVRQLNKTVSAPKPQPQEADESLGFKGI
ncbi:MAG: DMT family transporter [Jaaginema sp. PMC 1079.18]|nr:DMT family transporter [Jaaginema sp. PMC 1080.18]MEC4853229.1 DMT family transporter [Jaaginema sp. PMC 1079.18]MEC4868566.1 DMT family transporter [Jaaginema sp. PMC 1078.18]